MIGAALGWLTGGSAVRSVLTLLVGVAVGGTLAHQVHRAINAQAEVQRQRETLAAMEAAQSATIRLQEQADEATRRAAARTQTAQRAAAGARTELERLRQQLAAGNPGDASACPATAHRAATLEAVQRDCASALVELGRAADAHAADALKLYEAWPRPPD